MRRKIILISIIALAVISAAGLANSFAQGAQRVPTTTTIPTIPATSAGVSYGCQPLTAIPGSVIIGASGFVRVKCPNAGGVTLGTTAGITLTPSFVLTVGYSNISIILSQSSGNPCNYNFRPLMVGNVTVQSGTILNGTALTFSSSPQPGQYLATVYDYCLQYSNALTQGLGGFSVTWT